MAAGLNVFFFIFHVSFILFSLFGWFWQKTRRVNFFALILIGFSWFILGFWYGFGYCPCTDWHWQVRYMMGYYDMPASYIKFLLDSLTGVEWNARLVDIATMVGYLLALVLSIYVNFSRKKKENNKAKDSLNS